jgi:hypothetical protein
MIINRKYTTKQEEGVKVIVQCYSMVKLPHAELGNNRKIMWTEG